MKIPTWINIDQEVEVSIDADEIMAVLSESPNGKVDMLNGLNNIGAFLRGISDEMILKLNESQKKTVHNFLTDQAERFK